MDDVDSRLLDVLHELEEVARCRTPEQAHAQFDATTLQVFWMKWPDLSAWAGSLWRMLCEDMSEPSSPYQDQDLDEAGGSG